MATIYAKKSSNGVKGGKEQKFKRLQTLAQNRLYREPELEEDIQNLLAEGHRHQSEDLLQEIQKLWNRETENPCYQYQRDMYAANNENILSIVTNEVDIFMAVDIKNNVFIFRMSKALQQLFSERVLQKVLDSLKQFKWVVPIPRQESDVRHRMERLDHLIRNPQFDVDKAHDAHQAACGVEYHGCRHAVGHWDRSAIHEFPGSRPSNWYWRPHNCERGLATAAVHEHMSTYFDLVQVCYKKLQLER